MIAAAASAACTSAATVPPATSAATVPPATSAATGAPATSAATLAPPASAPVGAGASVDLRTVDWANRRYPGYTLRDGKGEMREYDEPGGAHDTAIWRLGHVTYVDLTGDGAVEAIVQIDLDSASPDGRSSSGSEVHVFGAAGAPAEVVRLGLIRSWSNRVLEIVVKGRELLITLRAADGPCVERWVLGTEGMGHADEEGSCVPVAPKR